MLFLFLEKTQRTIGPVNAHLISWSSFVEISLPVLEKRIFQEMTLTFHTFISSINCLNLPTFKSHASIVSEKTTVFISSYRKAKVSNLTLLKNRSRSTQGHHLKKNYDGLESQMPKYQV